MALPLLIKAVAALTTAYQNQVFWQTIATSGMNLIIGAAALGAVYLAADAFMSDDFLASPLDNLGEFNEGLATMNQSLADLLADHTGLPALAGIIDNTWQELALSPQLTAEAISDVDKELVSLYKTQSTYQEDGALFKQAQEDIDVLEGLKFALEGVENAQDITAGQIEFKVNADYEHGVIEEDAWLGFIDDEGYKVTWEWGGEEFSKWYDDEEDAKQKVKDLNEKYDNEAADAAKDHAQNLLDLAKAKNEEILIEEVRAQEELLGDFSEFADAREELFFGGNRGNFTGALYKTVTQGGIETLLHKTEIMQTNIFNGMTLPEMVDTISGAVLDEIRNEIAI